MDVALDIYNLIEEPWIPVRTKQHKQKWVRPADIWDISDPTLDIMTGRPDLDAAVLQFLIALTQTLLLPDTESDWRKLFKAPPTVEDVHQQFLKRKDAFNLNGDGPRFFQDREHLDGDPNPIEQLLVDSPGGNALKLNTDLFQHRSSIKWAGAPLVAMMLISLQTDGPAGGSGYRVGIRGGGPLTTILETKLIRDTIMLNVLPKEAFTVGDWNQKVFPWMLPTKTSEAGQQIFGQHEHPLMVLWGTPQRISILFDNCPKCDYFGHTASSNLGTHSFIKTQYGANYEDGSFEHPLSPYRRSKETESWRSLKSSAGCLDFSQWPTIHGNSVHFKQAKVYQHFRNIREGRTLLEDYSITIRVCGYDMDSAKARCWYEGRQPIFPLQDGESQTEIYDIANILIEVSEKIRKDTITCINSIRKKGNTKSKPEKLVNPSTLKRVLSTNLEGLFWQIMSFSNDNIDNIFDEEIETEFRKLKERWLNELKDFAINQFDKYTQLSSAPGVLDLKYIVKAKANLKKKINNNSYRTKLDLEV